MMPQTLEQARTAKDAAKKLMGRWTSVVGIGITRIDGGYGVKVNLSECPSGDLTLPHDVEGVPLLFEVTGPAHKL
jgi:hypothetical protein